MLKSSRRRRLSIWISLVEMRIQVAVVFITLLYFISDHKTNPPTPTLSQTAAALFFKVPIFPNSPSEMALPPTAPNHSSSSSSFHSQRNTCPRVPFLISGDASTTPHQDQDTTSHGRKTATFDLNSAPSEVDVDAQSSSSYKMIRLTKLKQLARAKIVELENQQQNKDIVGSQEDFENSTQQPKKNICPGIRVRGSRIYDSENGRTCHQCRQKTMDFVASCKNQREEKPCNNMYCLRCLLNRYQEKAEEVGQLIDWKCPKCRGICDCSLCMRKRGQQPVRIRRHATRTAGLQSALEVPAVNDPGNGSGAVNPEVSSTRENISAADGWQDVGTSNFKKAHLSSEVNLRVSVEEEKSEGVGGGDKNRARVRLKNLAWAKMIMPERSNSGGSLLERRKDDEVRQPVESTRIAEMENQERSHNCNKITPLTIKTVSNRNDVLSVLLSQNRIGYH